MISIDRSGFLFLFFINCFYLLTILGEIYYSRWSVEITSLSLLPLSLIFLATCKKQDVTFIFVERKTRKCVFSDFVVDGSCIYFYILYFLSLFLLVDNMYSGIF